MATEASTSTSTTVVASSAGGSRVPDPSVSAASTLDVQSVIRAVLGEGVAGLKGCKVILSFEKVTMSDVSPASCLRANARLIHSC